MGIQSNDPDKTYEQQVLERLWERYTDFRNVHVPDIESKGQLPITPREDIWGTKLRKYLNTFVQHVWRYALLGDEKLEPKKPEPSGASGEIEQTPSEDEKPEPRRPEPRKTEQTHCLFLGLCLWDPFRNDSPNNWALIDAEINQLSSEFEEYKKIIDGKKSVIEIGEGDKRKLVVTTNKAKSPSEGIKDRINTFYLLYKALKKKPLVIKVAYNTCPASVTTFPDMYDEKALGNIEEIKQQFERVVNAHQPFTPKGVRADGRIISASQRYIYYIPSLFYPKDAGTGIGGLILITTSSFSPDTLSTFQTVVDSVLTKVGINYLYGNFHDQSARSAISSIMSRNMSHNIGSHVIPRATVDAIRRRLVDMKMWPIEKSVLPSIKTLEEAKKLLENEESRIKLISNLKGGLDEYTQRKSDFLAEITTEPLMTTRPAFIYREVILPLVENTLFMDNLAANEGVRYDDEGRSNRLRIRFYMGEHELKATYKCGQCKERTGEGFYTYPETLPYTLTCFKHPDERLQIQSIENGEYDLEIELPGPLGEFALYSFLENYIRNVAKHNKANLSSDKPLDINIRIDEISDDLNYYQIRIWNNTVDFDKDVSINVDGITYNKLRDAISAHVQSPIIHPDGSLKRQAWGIAEMKICAALLRGPKDFVSEVVKGGQNLTVTIDSEVDQKPQLIYDFKVMKSRRACAILPTLTDGKVKDRLRKEGLWVFNTIRELTQELSRGESIASFRFALFDCTMQTGMERENILNELLKIPGTEEPSVLPKFPFRVLALADEHTPSNLPKCIHRVQETLDPALFSRMSGGEILQWLWGHWIERWLTSDSVRQTAVLNLYLEQNGKDDPTKKWAQHARTFNQSSERVKIQVYENTGSSQVNGLCDVPIGKHQINLIYDRHRGLRDKFDEFLREDKNWTYILLEKNSPDFTSLFWPKFPRDEEAGAEGDAKPEPWTLPWELTEAGLLRVLIIDERAAEFSMDSLGKETGDIMFGLMRTVLHDDLPAETKTRKWHLAWAAKVYICTHFGIEQEPDPIHERVKKRGARFPYLKVRVGADNIDYQLSIIGQEETDFQADAVLIHQGILDDWRDQLGSAFDQNKFLDRLRTHFPFVIVESGRGIPPNLSGNEKFLPFSLLQHNVLGDNIGKFGLDRVLMSLARRRGREII